MRFRNYLATFVLAAGTLTLAAHADPLLYSLSGTFSGTLGSSSFIDAYGTFYETANSDNVTTIAPGFYQNAGQVTLVLAGYAPISFNTTFLGVESEYNVASFYDLNDGSAIGAYSDDINSYDLTTALGPVVGFFVTSGFTEDSSQGLLTIASAQPNITFTASSMAIATTPEPSSLLLLSTGLLGLACLFRNMVTQKVQHDPRAPAS